MLDQLMDPAFTHDFKTYLLPRMTTQEARSYAQTSLGLEAGNVQVFLDFLEDEHDKCSGMVDTTPDQDDEDSLTTPWHHLPPHLSYLGQPWSSLALAAVALAQECEAQGSKDASEAETTQAWPGPSHQVAQMDLTEEWAAQGHEAPPWSAPTQESPRVVNGTAALSQSPSDEPHGGLAEMVEGSLGLKMGAATSQHAHGQRELKPGVDGPPQGGPSGIVRLSDWPWGGDSDVRRGARAFCSSKSGSGITDGKPPSALPSSCGSSNPLLRCVGGPPAPTDHAAIRTTKLSPPSPKSVTHTAPSTSILHFLAHPRQIPLSTRALAAM
jgi:hypothetical protein